MSTSAPHPADLPWLLVNRRVYSGGDNDIWRFPYVIHLESEFGVKMDTTCHLLCSTLLEDMELTQIATVASTLVPLGLYVGRSCLQRLKSINSTRKICVLMPRGDGKTYLCENLKDNPVIWFIDVDETLAEHSSEEEMNRLKNHEEHQRQREYDMLYSEVAKRLLHHVKEQQRVQPKLRVCFVSSCQLFAYSCFKPMSIFHVASDRHTFETKTKDNDDASLMWKYRSTFLEAVPDKRAVCVFSGLKELENKIRDHFSLQKTL